jgi:hypothetical protein
MRRLLASLALTAALSAPMAAVTAPSAAFAQNVAANNLVNVQVGDVQILKNVNVAAAVQVLANVCGTAITVEALAADLAPDGVANATCTATGAPIEITQANPGRRP